MSKSKKYYVIRMWLPCDRQTYTLCAGHTWRSPGVMRPIRYRQFKIAAYVLQEKQTYGSGLYWIEHWQDNMKNKDVIEAFVRGYNASNPTRSLWTLDGILYSYETPIAKASGGRLIWTTDKKHSVTTSKHLSQAVRAFAQIGGLLN